MMPAVSVIICTYNRCDSLKQTLESLQELILPKGVVWELIVVDNNSKDATKQVVEKFVRNAHLPLRYVFEGQPGLSHARNAGITQSNGEIVVFTDDDVIVDPRWLAQVYAAFQRYDSVALGGRIIPVWPGPKPVWFQENGSFATPKAIVYFDLGDEVCVPRTHPYGANMAFRRELFKKYGNFRVDLGRAGDALMGGEDIEFFERLKKAGERVLYIPDAVVHHPVGKERMQKAYFEAWCFNAARTAVRFEGLPRPAIYYFGVPRYYYRGFAENLLKYLFTFEPKRHFYYKLQLYITAGRIVETRRLGKQSTT